MADEKTEKKDKIDYDEQQVDLFPSWEGPRLERRTHIPARALAIKFTVPIPQTDEDALAMYGCDKATIFERGIIQVTYDKDTFIDAWKKDTSYDNASPEDYGREFEKNLVSVPTRKEKRSEAKADQALGKQVKNLAKELNLTTAEVLARLKALQG